MVAQVVSPARATLVTSTTGLTLTPSGPMAMIATGRPMDPPPPPRPPAPPVCRSPGCAAAAMGAAFLPGVDGGPRPMPMPKPPPEVTSAAVMTV
jgi:hypothetical protein